MPFVNGQFQGDSKSIMQRLFELQKAQDAMQQMKAARDVEAQRKQILQESYTPGEAARTEYSASNPLVNIFGLSQSGAAPSNFVERAQQGSSQNDALSLVPNVSAKQIEAKPAKFDAQSAIARLYGIGDTETASQLSAEQEKQSRDLNRWSGAVTYIDDPENPGVTIAVQPSTQGNGEAYRKIGVASMTPEARARVEQKNVDLANDREKMGMERQKFLFEQKKYYEGPEVQARTDALQALQKQRDSADATLAVINQIEPYLDKASGSDLEKMARKGGAFLGFDSAAATADKMIDMAAASLTLTAPKLGGAASDRDVALYETARGQLNKGTTEQKRAAIQFIRQSLQRFGAASGQPSAAIQQPGKPAASAAPMPSLPNPSQHKGRIVRDTSTGVRWQSNGSQWMRVK